jgi:hypothetical protein
MKIIKSTLLLALMFFNVFAFGQVSFGTGMNIGRNNGGIEFQIYTIERLKIFLGANLRKYNSFSNRIGAGVSILPLSNQHNFWVNSSFEYKYASTPILETNEINYTYYVNNLNYWNIEAAYSLRIDKFFDQDKFILIEAKVISKQLLNQLNLEPSVTNTAVDENYEARLRRYFYSGALLSVGVKFVW